MKNFSDAARIIKDFKEYIRQRNKEIETRSLMPIFNEKLAYKLSNEAIKKNNKKKHIK